MRKAHKYISDESGAVAVDWVVLTGAIVGIAIAVIVMISGGIGNAASGLNRSIGTKWNFDSKIELAAHYFDIGIAEFPNDSYNAWRSARLAVNGDAPDGYDYDPDRDDIRYVVDESGHPIYESTADDGKTLSIGGEIFVADDYDYSGDSTSFYGTFMDYWDEAQ